MSGFTTIDPAFRPKLAQYAAQARQDAANHEAEAMGADDPERCLQRAAERLRDAAWYDRLAAEPQSETKAA